MTPFLLDGMILSEGMIISGFGGMAVAIGALWRWCVVISKANKSESDKFHTEIRDNYNERLQSQKDMTEVVQKVGILQGRVESMNSLETLSKIVIGEVQSVGAQVKSIDEKLSE